MAKEEKPEAEESAKKEPKFKTKADYLAWRKKTENRQT